MTDLKLSRLPDRTPVKLTVHLLPELLRALEDYARVYEQAHGTSEPVAELVPAMLADFLENDRGFQKARRSLGAVGAGQG